MSLRDRLKKLSRHPGVIATVALAGTLVSGKMATHQNTAESNSPSQSEIMNYQPSAFENGEYLSPEFDEKIGQMFDISGTSQDIQTAKLSLFTLSNTPEGKKLLEDLNTTSSKLKLSFSNQLDETDYGSANLKKEGFPVELNSNLTKDHTKLTTTLFHELCHVRQYQQGVGTLGDLPEEKYDLTIAQEAEARLQTSLMASHLEMDLASLNDSDQWMDQSLILDGHIYDSLKSRLLSQNCSEKNADKIAKEEILKSIVSGKNTFSITQFVSENAAQQFQKINQDWLHTYSLNASAHAYDEFYSTMHSDGTKSSELLTTIANRLGVNKTSLLSPTGIDLVNLQKDDVGNILFGERISRGTHENMGTVKSSYDEQNRPVCVIELSPDNTLKADRRYSYETGELPSQLVEKTQNNQTTITYDSAGNRRMSVSEVDGLKTTIHYEAGQKAKEVEQNAYGIAETIYKNGEKTDYIYKTNDGTVIDEFHKKSPLSKNIPLNLIQSQKGMSH